MYIFYYVYIHFPLVDGFCSYEHFISPDDRGIYNWIETAVEGPVIVRVLDCDYEPQDLMNGGVARRACISNNTWVHPENHQRSYDGLQCITNSTYQLRLISRVRSNEVILLNYQLTSLHALQQQVTAENFESVGTAVVSIVSELNEEDERSEENLDIIANVYENITELVQTGQIMVTENVRKYQGLVTAFW